MSMPSDLSKAEILKSGRRIPQQDRGERRVAEVLEAAASVIAEVGYDAATMTAMAERAGASIGALYQYFPNKEAIAHALRHQYGNEMEASWSPLAEQGAKLSVRQMVDAIFDVMTDFMDNRPAYIPLMNIPRDYKRDPARRNRLREHFASLFRQKQPELAHDEAFRIANVVFQIVKGMNPLYAEANRAERIEIVREFKLLLTTYLSARLRT